ncbi:MAG: hypothetical protein IKY27_08795 [Bacteroidales bacterium]|nr:hypothetical protein [Bacteroidales bacterium]
MNIIKWLFGIRKHDSYSRPDEFEQSNSECVNEPIQVNVDDKMPDFLTEDVYEGPTDYVSQESLVDENNDAKGLVDYEPKKSSDSLLDNRPLVKIFTECADLLSEIDRISPRFKSPDSRLLLDLVNERLRTALYLSGGKPIDDDETFDSVRHICIDNPVAKEGTPISEIIEFGVALESRVFVKAKVKLTSCSL